MLGILYKILKEQRKQTKILQSIESRLKDNDNLINNMNTTKDVSSRESKSDFLFTAKSKKHQTFSNDFTKNQIQRVRMESKLKDNNISKVNESERIKYFIEQAGGKRDAKSGKPGVPSWYSPEYIDWWFNH